MRALINSWTTHAGTISSNASLRGWGRNATSLSTQVRNLLSRGHLRDVHDHLLLVDEEVAAQPVLLGTNLEAAQRLAPARARPCGGRAELHIGDPRPG